MFISVLQFEMILLAWLCLFRSAKMWPKQITPTPPDCSGSWYLTLSNQIYLHATMRKCLQLALFLIASRGRLLWLQNEKITLLLIWLIQQDVHVNCNILVTRKCLLQHSVVLSFTPLWGFKIAVHRSISDATVIMSTSYIQSMALVLLDFDDGN